MMMHPHDDGPPPRWWWSSRYHHDDPPPPPPNGSNSLSIILRMCGLVLAVTSASIMAAGSNGCNSVSFTHFGGFVYLVGSSITATILEVAAIYLQVRLDHVAAAAPDPDDKTVVTDMEEEEEGIRPAGILLAALDILVPALLLSAMGATFDRAAANNDQISACSGFAVQVMRANILSLVACLALMLAAFFKNVPVKFNLPPY